MKAQVCAVVVTHNRSQVLRRCLLALMAQTRPVDCILVVDNASTDGTANLLNGEFPGVEVLNLPRNVGSAGGFTTGIQWACGRKFDWVWTMDDDTLCTEQALQKLLEARQKFPLDHRPNLLASKVIWTDGSLHPVNLQSFKPFDPEAQFMAAEAGTISIRFTSFVSMLIHRSCVFRFGLPVADYFLSNDDMEYSAAILRSQLGVVVPGSVVTHATERKSAPGRTLGKRFYFEVRNKIWLMRRSDAFSKSEKRAIFRSLVRRTWDHVVHSEFRPMSLKTVVGGMWDGMTSNPRSNDVVLPRDWAKQAEGPAIPKLTIASALVNMSRAARRVTRRNQAAA